MRRILAWIFLAMLAVLAIAMLEDYGTGPQPPAVEEYR